MPVLRRKAPKIRGEGQTSTNQEAARLTADDPLAGPPQHLDDRDSGLPLGQMCLAVAHRQSGGLGLENWRSANKGKSEKGEAWLENVEIHPGFFPAKRTGCSLGSREPWRREEVGPDSRWKSHGRHFVKLDLLTQRRRI